MNIRNIFLFILCLTVISFCSMCDSKSPSSQNKKNNKVEIKKIFLTNQASFDSATGEFKVDQFTCGLWHFNEGNDIVLVDSVNENFGSINFSQWILGRFNSALKFDGTQSYVEIESSKSLNPLNAVSVELWAFIAPDQTENFPVLISKDSIYESSGNPSYEFYINNQLDDEFGYNICWRITTDKGQYTLPAGVEWQSLAGKWHYFAATYDGQEMKIYIDGELKKSIKRNGLLYQNNNPLRLSRKYAAGSNFFKGIIDEFRISNVARSSSAIKSYWDAVKRD